MRRLREPRAPPVVLWLCTPVSHSYSMPYRVQVVPILKTAFRSVCRRSPLECLWAVRRSQPALGLEMHQAIPPQPPPPVVSCACGCVAFSIVSQQHAGSTLLGSSSNIDVQGAGDAHANEHTAAAPEAPCTVPSEDGTCECAFMQAIKLTHLKGLLRSMR